MRAALAIALGSLAAAATPRANPADSRSCLACHAAQQAPLATSRHGLAYSPGLSGQLPTAGPHRGSGLACLLCHAPAADQQPWRSLAALPVDGGPGQTATEAQSLAISSSGVMPNPAFDPHARALGVSCSACHVRGDQIVGARADPRAPHPVARDPELDSVALCARCHQFGANSAVNGKPLENTAHELAQSAWGRAGATCESCHMPAGRHLFQGIHDPALVAASVEVRWTVRGPAEGELALTNTAVGHDFPTYVTPRVRLSVQPEDARGRALGPPAALELGRQVHFAGGAWREDWDRRVAPGQTRALDYALRLPPGTVRLHARVAVAPDASYVVLYRDLLRARALPGPRRRAVQKALELALHSGYEIFDQTRNVSAR